MVAFALAIWGVAGLVGLLIPAVADWVVFLPAVPLYVLSTAFAKSTVTHGVLWDSAHGPPFLNAAGIVLVYMVPIVFGITLLVSASKRASSH